jgi:16S rRNA (cytidine1402-2'-O)-methyltransferase
LLERVRDEPDTLVLYESPHRLVATLRDIEVTLGPERTVAVARELTKHFEEIVRGTSREAREHFEREEPRGEFTVVVAGRDLQAPANPAKTPEVRPSGRRTRQARHDKKPSA